MPSLVFEKASSLAFRLLKMNRNIVTFAVVLAFASIALVTAGAIADNKLAVATFVPTASGTGISGYALFESLNETHITVSINISGITTGPDALHGIHVHEFGDISNKTGSSAGGHWNPYGVAHSCPVSARSAGDMGNWQAVAGRIDESKELDLLVLSGQYSIVGRSVVLHAAEDDCAAVTSAGGRLAVGVIGVGNLGSGITNSAAASSDTSAAEQLLVCVVQGTSNKPTLKGQFAWLQSGSSGDVTAIGTLNLASGEHGIHVHQWGDLRSEDGTKTGSHYDPYDSGNHGFPGSTPAGHHSGDMGNISMIINDKLWYEHEFVSTQLTTYGVDGILGRGFIVHATVDDGSQPVGNAGVRWGQCTVGIASKTLTAVAVELPDQVPSGTGTSIMAPVFLVVLSVLFALF